MRAATRSKVLESSWVTRLRGGTEASARVRGTEALPKAQEGAEPHQEARLRLGGLSFAPHRNVCRSGASEFPAAVRSLRVQQVGCCSQHRDQGQGLGCPSGELTFACPAQLPSVLWLRKTPEPSSKATGMSTGGGHQAHCPTRRFICGLKELSQIWFPESPHLTPLPPSPLDLLLKGVSCNL